MSAGTHDPFALGGVQDDPVFALIEEYRRVRPEAHRLYQVWSAASPELDQTHPAFAPYSAAWNRWGNLGDLLTTTQPTTLKGVSALLDFTRELIEDDEATHETCLDMAIDVLCDLVEREGR